MNKFTKRICIEQLGLSEEEAKTILATQKRFPEVLEYNINEEGFLIDGRTLWKQLSVPKTTKYTDWIKKQVEIHEAIENTDFIAVRFETKNLIGGRPEINHTLTLKFAKYICMGAGLAGGRTSKEYKEAGRMWRDYFLLMEKAIRSKVNWDNVRHPQIQGYEDLKSALNNVLSEEYDGDIPSYIYSNEANMMNRCLWGMTARQIKELLETRSIRDSVIIEINKLIAKAQEFDCNLVEARMDYNQRKQLVESVHKNKCIDLYNRKVGVK